MVQRPRPASGHAELHSHTDHSDGSLSPRELVAAAVERQLKALAVTDHDTVGGIDPARRAADAISREAGISLELIAGIEFSAHVGDREIHVLGLFIDPTDADLVAAAERTRGFRRDRGREIAARLRDRGIDLDMEPVVEEVGGGSMGRPHLASALVDQGHVGSLDEAFHRWLGIGRPAFVPKTTLPAREIIGVIHGARGVAVLAHPGSSRVSEDAIGELASAGLDGLEVRHPRHSVRQEARLRQMAAGLGLLPSSGSDFHGPGRGTTALGAFPVSRERLEALRGRADAHGNASNGVRNEPPPTREADEHQAR